MLDGTIEVKLNQALHFPISFCSQPVYFGKYKAAFTLPKCFIFFMQVKDVLSIDIKRPKIDCLSLVMCLLLAQHKTGFFSIFCCGCLQYYRSKQGKP